MEGDIRYFERDWDGVDQLGDHDPKKQKLLKIKGIIEEYTKPYTPEFRFARPYPLSTIETNQLFLEIWEVVKDE